MSRFAVVYEDPSYEQEEDIMDYLNAEIDGPQELSTIVDGWVRISVAEKQQIEEEFGPYITINS